MNSVSSGSTTSLEINGTVLMASGIVLALTVIVGLAVLLWHRRNFD